MTRTLGRRWAAAGLLSCLTVAGCSETPTSPGSPTPQPPTPPPANAAPVIRGITVAAARAEVGQSISVVADVQDAETALNSLTYEWTASAGTVSGDGRSVAWSLPPRTASTPVDVTLTLTVVEPYQALVGSQIVTRQHRVSATSDPIRAHDSVAEIGEMALHFLIELFGDSDVTPDDAIVDFNRDVCEAGWQAEYDDIVNNRATAEILSAEATIQSVAVPAPFAQADVQAACTFRDIYLPTMTPRTAVGTCRLTSVYEQDRWWLCTSNFDPASTAGVTAAAPAETLRRSGYR